MRTGRAELVYLDPCARGVTLLVVVCLGVVGAVQRDVGQWFARLPVGVAHRAEPSLVTLEQFLVHLCSWTAVLMPRTVSYRAELFVGQSRFGKRQRRRLP